VTDVTNRSDFPSKSGDAFEFVERVVTPKCGAGLTASLVASYRVTDDAGEVTGVNTRRYSRDEAGQASRNC
jgi:hypothetical protein